MSQHCGGWNLLQTQEQEQTDATDEKVINIKVREQNVNIYIIYVPNGMTSANKARQSQTRLHKRPMLKKAIWSKMKGWPFID